MLKKDTKIKWNAEEKYSFDQVKQGLTRSLVLIILDFTKDFLIFSFGSEHTIATMLLQKNNEGHEQPISFLSQSLRDDALKYNFMENKALALVKSIKYFRVYILHSHIIAYVPNPVVKDILTQNSPDGKRGKWISIIFEYDIEIKPTKLITCQRLDKLMDESNSHDLDINFLAALYEQEEHATPQVTEAFATSLWYGDLIFVLHHLQDPIGSTNTKDRFLIFKSMKFFILDDNLYSKDAGGILLNCLLKDEEDKVM
jgi:hypothetical protein